MPDLRDGTTLEVLRWAIVFDFPEVDDPVFAGWVGDVLGIAPTIETAARFDSEAVALRTLEHAYGPSVAQWGVVVEVAA